MLDHLDRLPCCSGTAMSSPGWSSLNAMLPGHWAIIMTSGMPDSILVQPGAICIEVIRMPGLVCSSTWWEK